MRWRRSSCLFLLAALALYPVPGSLTLPNPVTLRAVQLLPLSALIAGAGAIALWDVARRLLTRTPALGRRAVLAALVVGALIPIHFELAHRYEDYFDRYPRAVAPHFYYGLKEALAFARAHEAEYDEVWVTDTNQPYIYFLFFRSWSPDDVHRDLQVKRDPPAFNQVYAFGKYHFVLLPEDLQPSALPVLETIGNPDGSIAYLVRGAVVPNHGRVLIIAKR